MNGGVRETTDCCGRREENGCSQFPPIQMTHRFRLIINLCKTFRICAVSSYSYWKVGNTIWGHSAFPFYPPPLRSMHWFLHWLAKWFSCKEPLIATLQVAAFAVFLFPAEVLPHWCAPAQPELSDMLRGMGGKARPSCFGKIKAGIQFGL